MYEVVNKDNFKGHHANSSFYVWGCTCPLGQTGKVSYGKELLGTKPGGQKDPDDPDMNSAKQTKWSRLKVNKEMFWGCGQIHPHKTKTNRNLPINMQSSLRLEIIWVMFSLVYEWPLCHELRWHNYDPREMAHCVCRVEKSSRKHITISRMWLICQ